jgi:predicted RNA methylase
MCSACVRRYAPGFEEPVVKVEVQVMSLDVVHDEHQRHRPRELAERVEDVLRLPGDAGLERRVVDLGAAPGCRRFAIGMKMLG